MSRSFVLSELQPILFVSQNRLEMGASSQMRREKLIAQVRLWPRVEMARSFVLSELRRFLHFDQNRVEMQLEAVFRGPRSVAREAKPRSGRAS
jgi:hypothetical protein